MSRWYNRDGTVAVESVSELGVEAWREEMQKYNFSSKNRRVGLLHLANPRITVSTVFLGLDHNWDGGPPVLFETMVFLRTPTGWESDGRCWRYNTEAEAIDGHRLICNLVQKERCELLPRRL